MYYSVLVLLYSSFYTCNNLLAKIIDNNFNNRTSTYWFVRILRFSRCKPHTSKAANRIISLRNKTLIKRHRLSILWHNNTVCLPHDNRDNYCAEKRTYRFSTLSLSTLATIYTCYRSATNAKYKWILGHLLHFLNLCILTQIGVVKMFFVISIQ